MLGLGWARLGYVGLGSVRRRESYVKPGQVTLDYIRLGKVKLDHVRSLWVSAFIIN